MGQSYEYPRELWENISVKPDNSITPQNEIPEASSNLEEFQALKDNGRLNDARALLQRCFPDIQTAVTSNDANALKICMAYHPDNLVRASARGRFKALYFSKLAAERRNKREIVN